MDGKDNRALTQADFGRLWNDATVTEPEPLQVGRRITVADVLRMAQEEAGKLRAEHAAEMARLRTEHAAEMARLRAEHAAEMAQLRETIADLEATGKRQQDEFADLIAGRTAYISERYIPGSVFVNGPCAPGRYVLLTGRQAELVARQSAKTNDADWRGYGYSIS